MRTELEIMRVLRQPPLGKLAVEVAKQRYEQLGEIQEKNIQQLLLAAIGELVGFAGGYQVLIDAGVAPPLAAEAAPAARPETAPAGAGIRRVVREETAVSPPTSTPNLNIVAEINTILKRQLANHPDLPADAILLGQDPAGGLRIQANGKTYQRPEELEDETLKTILRQALVEWEKS